MSKVTYRQISELIQYRSDLLMAGRFDDLARHYTLPLITYLDGQPSVIADLAGLIQMFRQLRNYRAARGILALRAAVGAVELPRADRMRVWVRYAEMGGQDVTGQQTDCVLYLRQAETGLVSEMIEFQSDYERVILAA